MTASYRPATALATSGPLLPRARFASSQERESACDRLAAASVLVVPVTVSAGSRGRLADKIDESIDRELDARGAAPPGIGAHSDADAALSDQLFRARRVGAMGIAIALGPLHPATSRGALEPEDSATLRFLARATTERPVWVFLDAADANTPAYGDPVALASVIAEVPDAEAKQAPGDRDTTPATPEPDADAVVTANASADATPDPLPPIDEADTDATHVPVAPNPPTPDLVPLAARHTTGAAIAQADDAWRAWALALTAARGPQPLAAFERLFAREYMPLAGAIAAGLEEPRAIQAHEEFRRTFARAYTEACPAFAVTGKRPRMVMDAPDVAARIARLHGARSTQILLVDAMRFDIGARVKEAVRQALGPEASLTDELILWSALPTSTLRQLETLQRGADALRAPNDDGDRETESLRGRTAEVIRRVKVGSRDLYKLDVIEARVRDLGSRALPAFEEIAEAAAASIVRHARTLKPRTLLFVFGDHGFTFDRAGVAHQGGASPEEVLVPAFALLVGDVH